MKTLSTLLLGTLLTTTTGIALASDLAKEKRWADQVVDAIIDGEAEWLNDGSNDFLSIYTEPDDDSKRGLIIMHGTGIHPNWQQVVYPLRVDMTGHGWHTLSIQMPILPNEAEYQEYLPLYPEVPPRVDAAVAFFKDKGIEDIVLVGHSQGAAMGAYHLARKPDGIKAFVAIGAFSSRSGDDMDSVKQLSKIKLPVLDIYGSEDLEEILVTVADRKQAITASGSKQVEVEGANHFFDGKNAELIEQVSSWLDSL